jgi:outer membrane protein assembly factor BamB
MNRLEGNLRPTARAALLALAAASIVASPNRASAQDWPQWRGPNRDGVLTGFQAPQTWPEQFTRQWSVPVGEANASPALVGDRLFVFVRQGDEEVTLALNAANGERVWRDAYETPAVVGPAIGHPGPRGSPTVADGKVLVLGVTGILSCLNAADGALVWRKDAFPGQFPTFYTGLSPIAVDDMAIAHLGSEQNGAIIAFDMTSGEEKWRWSGDGPAYGSPVVATIGGVKQIITIAAGNVVGVASADGRELWRIPLAGGGRAYFSSTPIVDGSTIYITAAGQGFRAARIAESGGAFTAEELWSTREVSSSFNTPVLKNGLLFGLSEGRTYYCINASNGQVAWQDSERFDRFGSILDGGSVMLGLSIDGNLVVFRPSAEGFARIASVKVADSQTYAHPIVSGNRVFVKDETNVTLWTIE